MRVRPAGSASMTAAATLVAAAVMLAALSAVHLSQGTATELTWMVLTGSRLPRLLAGLLVGLALGVAGAILQAIARNPLASPDTLAVNAGARLMLTLVAALGIGGGVFSQTAIAFFGGLAAAALVVILAGRSSTPARLVLAGSVIALGLFSLSTALLLLYSQETQGLFAWGAGSLAQPNIDSVAQLCLPILATVCLAVLFASKLDLLGLGDDAATGLGVSVARVRLAYIGLAVFLSAAAVTLAGPIGFIGLCAPAAARAVAARQPLFHRQRWMLPLAGLCGAGIVVAADVVLRAVLGARDAVAIPTGVATTLLGGIAMIVMSRGMRSGTSETSAAVGSSRRSWFALHPLVVTGALAVIVLMAGIAALLLGDGLLLLGDVSNWVQGIASRRITWVLDTRAPRVGAALLAGAALALAGALTQTVARNPLADPGLLGVSSGAGVGAISVIALGGLSTSLVNLGALLGAGIAAVMVCGIAARSGWDPTRLVLVGLGTQAIASALTTLIVVATDPWNQSRAITWLGGSTYGATLAKLWPLAIVMALSIPALAWLRRDLDLIQLDDTTPRLLGVGVARSRLLALLVAIVLAAAATAAVGVIGFVGLVAPHLARALVGTRHERFLPLSAVLGAGVVLIADAVGRSVLAPQQLPVGVVCALIGLPIFVLVVHRTGAQAR